MLIEHLLNFVTDKNNQTCITKMKHQSIDSSVIGTSLPTKTTRDQSPVELVRDLRSVSECVGVVSIFQSKK